MSWLECALVYSPSPGCFDIPWHCCHFWFSLSWTFFFFSRVIWVICLTWVRIATTSCSNSKERQAPLGSIPLHQAAELCLGEWDGGSTTRVGGKLSSCFSSRVVGRRRLRLLSQHVLFLWRHSFTCLFANIFLLLLLQCCCRTVAYQKIQKACGTTVGRSFTVFLQRKCKHKAFTWLYLSILAVIDSTSRTISMRLQTAAGKTKRYHETERGFAISPYFSLVGVDFCCSGKSWILCFDRFCVDEQMTCMKLHIIFLKNLKTWSHVLVNIDLWNLKLTRASELQVRSCSMGVSASRPLKYESRKEKLSKDSKTNVFNN